jgi:hypothetical protein
LLGGPRRDFQLLNFHRTVGLSGSTGGDSLIG